ncbi:MAG: YcxB family protein [Clostridium fessum]
MQEFEYRLEKEDYKNWIHWNVLKHESKKMKMVSALLYVAFLALFLGKNVTQAKGNLVLLVPSIVIAVLVGIGMFYMISNQNQERMIWKRSGLKNLEKTGNFPVVHLTLDEKTLTMTVAAQEMTKTYSYSDIEQMVEIERMYLLETNEKTWQFIAKSAFSSEEEQKQFETFMNEKLADAKENPEEYPSVTKIRKMRRIRRAAPCIRTPRLRMMLWKLMSRRSPAWIQAIWVRLEKWRILSEARLADEEETDEPEKAEPDTTDSHENVEEKTDAVNEEKVDE